MSEREDIEAAVELMQKLADAFGTAVDQAIESGVVAIKQSTHAPDPIVLAAVVNGGLIGILTYMARQSAAGRMADPHGHLTRLFHMAGTTWDDIRTGKNSREVTLQ